VRVRTPNRRPVPVADTKTVHVASFGQPIEIAVLDNDTDPNHDPLSVSSVSAVTGLLGGRARVASDGQHVIYRPGAASMLPGTASFRYTVVDGHGGLATATVTVAYGNQAPIAADDRATTPATGDRSVVVPVLANDRDPDGDRLSVAQREGPDHGTVKADGAGFRYTPEATFVGTDSFTYTASDAYGGSSTATVTITVVAPHSDLSLTEDHSGGSGEGVVVSEFTAGGIPAAREAIFTLTITGFDRWSRYEWKDGSDCADDPVGTTVTVTCIVTGNEESAFPFLRADFHPTDNWTIDAVLKPRDFTGASADLHRAG
jgi:hypothetical protein